MTIFAEETMTSHLRGREHIKWLESQLGEPDSHPIQENNARSHVRAEMIATEIYHGIVWLLEAYPQIARVRPIWEPVIEPQDRSILVRVRLEIDSTDLADQEDVRDRLETSHRTRDPLDAYYSYADRPPSIPEEEGETFDTLVELCEQIGPETWEGFHNSRLDKNKGYTSVSQVMEEMDSELGPFLAHLRERLMEKGLPMPSDSARPKAKVPGSRM